MSGILSTAVALNVAELSGEVQGFLDIYDSYDPDPDDPLEEGRLESRKSDSARVIGRLSGFVDLLPDPDTAMDADEDATLVDLALESAALVLPLTFLRIQAMIERELVYGAREIDDARRYAGDLANRLARILPNLRRRSNSRFTGLSIWRDPEPGSNVENYSYRFNRQFGPVLLDETAGCASTVRGSPRGPDGRGVPEVRGRSGPGTVRGDSGPGADKGRAAAGDRPEAADRPNHRHRSSRRGVPPC